MVTPPSALITLEPKSTPCTATSVSAASKIVIAPLPRSISRALKSTAPSASVPVTDSKTTRLPPAVLIAVEPACVPVPKSTPSKASAMVMLPPPVVIAPVPKFTEPVVWAIVICLSPVPEVSIILLPKLTLPTANA